MEKKNISVIGMMCAVCSANEERKLRSLDGVKDVAVSLPGRSAQVEYDPGVISLQQMKDEVAATVAACRARARRQSAPDRPEDAAKLPVLSVKDVPAQGPVPVYETTQAAGATLLRPRTQARDRESDGGGKRSPPGFIGGGADRSG